MIKEGSFVIIKDFMGRDLDLKGAELIVYAVIYGYCKDGDRCSLPLQLFADWSGCNIRNVQNIVDGLVRKGYIRKYRRFNQIDYELITEGENFCIEGDIDNLDRLYQQSHSAKIADGKNCRYNRQKLPIQSEEIADTIGKNCRNNRQKLPTISNSKYKVNNKVNKSKGETPQKPVQKRDVFAEYAKDNEALLKALQDFREERKKLKAPMTERSQELLVSRLKSLAPEDTKSQIAMLEEATLNGWKSVYKHEGGDNNGHNNSSGTAEHAETEAERLARMEAKWGKLW